MSTEPLLPQRSKGSSTACCATGACCATACSPKASLRKESSSISGFENFIRERERQPLRSFCMKEQQNIKEAEVLDLLIRRITYHAEKIGNEPEEHKIIARLRIIVTELREFQKRLKGFELVSFFIEEVEAIENLRPFPDKRHLDKFVYSLNKCLDKKIKFEVLDSIEYPDAFDPEEGAVENEEQESQEDEEKGGGEEGEDKGEAEDEEEEQNEDDDKGAVRRRSILGAKDPEKVDETDFIAVCEKLTLKQIMEKLTAKYNFPNASLRGKDKEDLADMLAEAARGGQMETVEHFAKKWWQWKMKKTLPDKEAGEVKRMSEVVAAEYSVRIDEGLVNFSDSFPICKWFSAVLQQSLAEQHFGVLQEELEKPHKHSSVDIAWTYLGYYMAGLVKKGYIDDTALGMRECPDFAAAIEEVYTKVLPTFLLQLTRVKAVMVSQTEQTIQLRNKVLAGCMTAGFAAIQFGFKWFEKQYEVDDN